MKKALSLALSIIMIISVICGMNINAYAATISAPTGVSITIKSSAKVKISWSKVKKATKYYVYQSTKANSGYKKVAATTKTNAEIKGLKKGKTYYFKVKAVKGSSVSADSIIVTNWGSIKGVESSMYSVRDFYSWEEEGPGFAGYTLSFKKVSDASGYQYKHTFYGTTVTKSVKKNTNKWYFGTQDVLGTIKARAYKKVAGKTVYGPWKTVIANDQFQDYDGEIYLDDWENIIKGYTKILLY